MSTEFFTDTVNGRDFFIPKGLKTPKGERTYVSYYNRDSELIFVLTGREPNRDWFYMYAIEDGKMKKLGKARTPPELEERYGVLEAMHSGAETPKKSCRKKEVVIE